ncbi:MAG: DNA repair protein RecN [Acidobacteria bacterium]|nr:MAG: DNA repair protein RecN [Acidobacteriota bacterium]
MAYKRRDMLRFLRVRNFALIDQLELHFEDGFNLLSGETGAGKSIIVDALGLLAGSKASAEMVRTGESRAIIEAVFEADLKAELGRLGLDAGDLEAEMIIRREISPDDRNRVFINNQPTTVSSLRELAPSLLDIHGQHEQQTLLDHARQLDLIDAYADSVGLAGKVREIFTTVEAAEAEIAELIAEHARKIERSDLLIFQRDEIQKTDPQPGEAEEVRRKLEVLSNAEKLLGAAARGYEALYEAETSVVSTIAQVQRVLREAAQHDSRLERLIEQIETARISLQDVAYALRDYAGNVDADPQQLEQAQGRLAELERLHRKYGPDLLEHLHKVRRELDSIGLTETKKDELQIRLAALKKEYAEAASLLSGKRRAASKSLESAVERELKSLAMPQARFVIAWQDVSPGRASGIDRPELLISANSGEEPRPLERIVSGGELSRVMLALRSVLAVDRPQKTLVFDEIDAGIGGKAAETVGQKLKELSMRYQVLCVTHLAQIAAFAAHQYRIDKNVLDGRSVTRVAALHGDERIEELVRMMSGSRVTHAAREHVKELLKATKA